MLPTVRCGGQLFGGLVLGLPRYALNTITGIRQAIVEKHGVGP